MKKLSVFLVLFLFFGVVLPMEQKTASWGDLFDSVGHRQNIWEELISNEKSAPCDGYNKYMSEGNAAYDFVNDGPIIFSVEDLKNVASDEELAKLLAMNDMPCSERAEGCQKTWAMRRISLVLSYFIKRDSAVGERLIWHHIAPGYIYALGGMPGNLGSFARRMIVAPYDQNYFQLWESRMQEFAKILASTAIAMMLEKRITPTVFKVYYSAACQLKRGLVLRQRGCTPTQMADSFDID